MRRRDSLINTSDNNTGGIPSPSPVHTPAPDKNSRPAGMSVSAAAILAAVVIMLHLTAGFDPTGLSIMPLCAMSVASAALISLSFASIIPLSICVGGYMLAALSSGSFLSALVYLFPLPAAAVIILSLSGGLPAEKRIFGGKSKLFSLRLTRTECIIALTVLTLILGLSALYIAIRASGVTVAEFTASESERFADILRSFTETAAEAGNIGGNENMTAIAKYTEDMIQYYVGYLRLMLPSIFVTTASVFAYTATLFFRLLAKTTRCSYILGEDGWRFTLSRVTAIVFIVSYVLNILGGNLVDNTITAASGNLVIILTPGLAVIGVKHMLRRIRSPKGLPVAVLYGIVIFVLAFLNIFMIFTLASFIGVIDIMTGGRRLFDSGE